jgi:hypothetical protein
MRPRTALFAGLLCVAALPCRADVVLDVHAIGLQAARAAGMPAAPASIHFTVAAAAMFDAANAIEGRYRPYRAQPPAPANGNAEAAALGAGCAALAGAFPSQAAAVTAACDALARSMPSTDDARASRAYGEAVGKAAIAARQAETKTIPNAYRQRTAPGAYVSEKPPIGFDFAHATPFALTSVSQFRPAAPPKLDSDVWARDYNEVKTMGARNSTVRTAEQTATSLFWASNGPQQFVDSVAALPMRGTTADRARVLALAYMAMVDAGYAVFDAKYAYDFWRPITAIRNGGDDGNPATEPDAAWTPLVDTPPHQEYPCAHCTVAAALMTVLATQLPAGQRIELQPSQLAAATAKPRSWAQPGDAVAEVANARVWGGIHYRNSADVGVAMGKAIGKFVVDTRLQPLP